ncbi:MAG: hypothetical protein ACLR71_09245 [[Clostridium] scindens]
MVLFFRVVTITILIAYAIYMYRDIIKHKEKDSFFHMILYGIMGFVLNLLDTLGVGSNATQMAFFKLTKSLARTITFPRMEMLYLQFQSE